MLALLLCAATVLTSCRPAHGSAGAEHRITVAGVTRTYRVHIPAGGSGAGPVVLALHGALGTGEGLEALTGLDRVADERGLILVYPDGFDRSWADGRGVSPADKAHMDDVAFLAAVLDAVRRDHPAADRSRAFVLGMSNGAMMAHRLGCELSDRITAVAAVAGGIPATVAMGCHPARPPRMLDIQGTADPLVPYTGGEVTVPGTGQQRGELLSASDTATHWARLAGCAGPPTAAALPDRVDDGTTTGTLTWCAGQVELYAVTGGGHTWPGGVQYLPAVVVGPTARDFDASQVIGAFFAR
ncbi:esterase [Longispora fulva]|nr:PHB depolymerase family esterase [Longispora fulva]GIG62620.1 esterase [Longispora fulva]